MDTAQATDLMRQTVLLTLRLGTPILLSALLVALVVSVLQAATQIQDLTLSLIPKILAVALAALIFGPWILETLVDFGRQMFAP